MIHQDRMLWLLGHQSFWIGLMIRFVLAYILPAWLDDTSVPYTDIDYHVFTDAAAYIENGSGDGSPYQRTTYRYTPFLAQMFATLPRFRITARYLLCLADAICGWMIAQYRQHQRRRQERQRPNRRCQDQDLEKWLLLLDAMWWQYNPLAIHICTRGSAEPLMVLLPVLATIWLVTLYQQQQPPQQKQQLALVVMAGICHGIAVHAKLYPIIYSLSYVINLANNHARNNPSDTTPTSSLARFWDLLKRTTCPAPLVFGIVSAATFAGCTALAVYWYGRQALDEGLLYHFSRVDHRHNYSMHWYWIYLARARANDDDNNNNNGDPHVLITPWTGRLLLLPQLVLLLCSSIALAPVDLTLALFTQTFLFVAHNKVITAQYFTWYLCLLPLCSRHFGKLPLRRLLRGVAILLLSVGTWLGSAYLLEMQGMAVHRLVWMASLAFYAAQVYLLGILLSATPTRRPQSFGAPALSGDKPKLE